jgi:hypothetical protein
MKKNLYNLFIFSGLAILSSCNETSFQTVVEYTVPVEKKRLVINAEVTAGKDTMVVLLSRSRTTSEAIEQDANLAKAVLTVNKDGVKYKDLTFVEMQTAQDGNQQDQYMYKYIALIDPKLPLVNYSLKGAATGYDDITADDVLAPFVAIKDARFEVNGFESVAVVIGGKPTKTIQDLIEFTIDDPAGNNYYLIEVRTTQVDNQGNTSQRLANFSMNQQFSAGSNGFTGRKAIIPDQTFQGKSFKIQLGVSTKGKGGGGGPGGHGGGSTVTEFEVILRSVSRNTYLFEQSLAAYNANNGNPFADPVVLSTNVFKGYGLFSMQQKTSVVVKP